MKPLLGIELRDAEPDELRELEAHLNSGLEQAPWWERGAALTLITTEEELREFEAGTLVLYKKRPRARAERYAYEKGGQRVELEQLTLLDSEEAATP